MPYGKKSPAKMGHSPLEGHCMGSAAKMGHSPVKNHHYGMRKGESVKQEKYNLMNDNPVARDASGGRSWMSKHSRSAMMMKGPMEMGHSPAEMGHSPLEIEDDGSRGKARKEYDIRKGILDPKTGKRTFKESKRKQKVFVTKMGKVLPVGSKAK